MYRSERISCTEDWEEMSLESAMAALAGNAK